VGKTSPVGFSAQRLAAARPAAGLSNAELASLVDARRQEVVRWQSSTSPRTPRPELQLRLAHALGVDLSELCEPTAVTLATLRRDRGLTQAALAQLTGIPRSTIQALEAGAIAGLREEHRELLARHLRVSADVVIGAHAATARRFDS
jgi:transcriptional regulator with XRE-family HTH domain